MNRLLYPTSVLVAAAGALTLNLLQLQNTTNDKVNRTMGVMQDGGLKNSVEGLRKYLKKDTFNPKDELENMTVNLAIDRLNIQLARYLRLLGGDISNGGFSATVYNPDMNQIKDIILDIKKRYPSADIKESEKLLDINGNKNLKS